MSQHTRKQVPPYPSAQTPPASFESPASPGRRDFLGKVGATAAAGAVLPLLATDAARAQSDGVISPLAEIGPTSGRKRERQAYHLRVEAAQKERDLPVASHPTNTDEDIYPNRIGNFSKGLPHNSRGEVDLAAYNTLINALKSGNPADFEKITLGGANKLTNPQAGLAFEMEGPDAHCLTVRAAPAFSSAEEASEMAENYWMALLRDVPFSRYGDAPLAAVAANDLSGFSDFRGPKAGGRVTTGTLFRGLTPGDLAGPYVSQFMWLPTPFGAEFVERRIRTRAAGVDYLTDYADWLAAQNGAVPGPGAFDPERRYIRNGRDLGEWVHIDVLFQGYFNALLILASLGAPPDPGNPYRSAQKQIGFGTLGDPYIASLVCAVARPALKAVWYQKWFVHRRLRPEEFAGRVHLTKMGEATYPVHSEILNSDAPSFVEDTFDSFLLPMAFPEGCPTHPAYGAGHATVAGACVTVLKAFFDESFVIPNPVQATDDGLELEPYNGPALTVGGELNKLASNVAIGRNIAGVHWRSDATESLKLGEEIAIRYMREEKECFNEQFAGFSLTKFDGTTITI